MSTSPTDSPPGWRTDGGLDVWGLPGFDKETFYAAALYLHAAAKGQLREVRTRERYVSTTDEATRDFLDQVADCFARSKRIDPSAHVTATAMVKHRKESYYFEDWDSQESRSGTIRERFDQWEASRDTRPHTLTVIIAKNHSEKGMRQDILPDDHDRNENENNAFAKELFTWFTDISQGRHIDRASAMDGIWGALCRFNQSRLEYYVLKMADMDATLVQTNMEQQTVIDDALVVMDSCRQFRDSRAMSSEDQARDAPAQLAACARLAAKCRSHGAYQGLYQNVDAVLNPEDIDINVRQLAKFAKMVTYLGRFGAACDKFYEYCTSDEIRDCLFNYELLQSPEEEAWPTATYKRKIEAWTGPLGLDDRREGDRQPVRAVLDDFARRAGSRGSARLHCEIQLLKYLTRPGRPRGSCDYIGCSKKSCWLCWQFMGHFGSFTTKDAHRMIYPMWSVPSAVLLSDARMAEATGNTYNDMLRLIQEKMLHGREFSLRQNITHTSPRLLFSPSTLSGTTLHIASSASAVLAKNPAVSRPPHLAPFAKVPVIHLPAAHGEDGPEAPYMLEMDLYLPNILDDVESWMHGVYDNETRGVFACQLNTKLEVSTKASVGTQEYQSSFWTFGGCLSSIESGDSRFVYQLLYRTENEELDANPWLLATMRAAHGASVVADHVPWRGDVFVFAHAPRPESEFRLATWRQIWRDAKALRPVACLPRIEEFIAKTGLAQLTAKKSVDWEDLTRQYTVFTSLGSGRSKNGIDDYWPDL